MYTTIDAYEISDDDIPNYSPKEWESIISDYMNAEQNDSGPDDSDSEPNVPQTNGWGNPRVNQWYKRTGGIEFMTGPSNAGLREGYTVPMPLINQGAKLENLVPDVMNEPAKQELYAPVVQSNFVPQNYHFYTGPVPSTGIYAPNNVGITNVNNGQYLSNVSPETIGYLNQPAQSRNINAMTDDGNIMCINCVDCRNCFNCTSCKICEKCISCNTCNTCSLCLNCVGSTNCINCEDCNNCKSVRDSTKCTNCNNCMGCKDCTNCNDLSWAIGYVNNKPKM